MPAVQLPCRHSEIGRRHEAPAALPGNFRRCQRRAEYPDGRRLQAGRAGRRHRHVRLAVHSRRRNPDLHAPGGRLLPRDRVRAGRGAPEENGADRASRRTAGDAVLAVQCHHPVLHKRLRHLRRGGQRGGKQPGRLPVHRHELGLYGSPDLCRAERRRGKVCAHQEDFLPVRGACDLHPGWYWALCWWCSGKNCC